ncbi:MAG: FAD-dependent oxidoreductase [Pseudomonadota bacterium]
MVSRRQVIRTGSALAAMSALPTVAHATDSELWDVIVVGGGTAGLPTALFSAERSNRVLVIEKGPILGGTLDRSAGQVAAAGTVFQAAKNIEDTPDAHYEDIVRINDGTSDPALIRLFVEHAADALNWLAANGYEVEPNHPVTGQGHEHFRTARYQWGVKGGWSIYEAMAPLAEQAVKRGALQINLNTSATELMIDNRGHVVGVVSEAADGKRHEHRARNVVLASGGCASNPTMFEELHGIPLYCQVAHPNSQGIGITLGLAAGGYVRGGEHYQPLPGALLANDNYPALPTALAPLNPTLRLPWEILVNADGKRFVREDDPHVHNIETAIRQQQGERHWAIFDDAILEKAPPLIPDWSPTALRDAVGTHPMIDTANSIGELANAAGLDADTLIATVEIYNRARENDRPDPHGLEHRPLPIAKPPFYAVRMNGWTLISFAGLGVNDKLQVTNASGTPIPNLYAVGEVIGAGATSGNAYTNGMLVTPGITFGRLLGKQILPFG